MPFPEGVSRCKFVHGTNRNLSREGVDKTKACIVDIMYTCSYTITHVILQSILLRTRATFPHKHSSKPSKKSESDTAFNSRRILTS